MNTHLVVALTLVEFELINKNKTKTTRARYLRVLGFYEFSYIFMKTTYFQHEVYFQCWSYVFNQLQLKLVIYGLTKHCYTQITKCALLYTIHNTRAYL